MNAVPLVQLPVTAVVQGVNVTVPFTSAYVPTFGTSTAVETQFGAFTPGAHNFVELEFNVTPFGVVSFVNRFTLCAAPTTPLVMFGFATAAAGGVTVGVIVELAY